MQLSNLRTLDFFTNFWGPKLICHIFVSFDFGPDGYVCISIETRMKKGQGYSAIAGLYRQYELYYVIGSARPWDWQLLLNGFIAERAYELGAIDTSLPFAELRRLSYIDHRARDADDDPSLSDRLCVLPTTVMDGELEGKLDIGI